MRLAAAVVACFVFVAARVYASEPDPRPDSTPRLISQLTAQSPIRDATNRVTGSRLAGDLRLARQRVGQQLPKRQRSWLRRHPACLGALIGFATGFAIGYLPGDDGVFYDFDASFNGLVIGGVGAAVGGITGAVLGR